MAAKREITWAGVRAWRMARQLLDGPGAESVEQVVATLTTVPAWSGDAELAVGLRRSTPEPGGVAAAFERGRLIKTFAFRGATHYFVPEDVGVYLALRATGRQWEMKSWREFYRLEPADWPALREEVRSALANGPITQSQLASAVSATARFRHLETAFAHKSLTFIKPFAWQGDLSIAPGGDEQVILQCLENAPGFDGLPAIDDAGPRALLAYLDAYGPASVDNLLYWFGDGLSAGRKNILKWIQSLVGTRVVEFDIEGTAVLCRTEHLDDLARPQTAGITRLIPGFDQWVLGPGTADANVVPARHRAEISRGANIVIVDGRIEGTWNISKGVIVASRFDGSAFSSDQLDSQTRVIGALLGQSLELE